MRLDVFQLLTKYEPHGLPAGEIPRVLSVPHTMSAHLAILTLAGLVSPARHSRSVVYRAVLSRFQEIALYLIMDCCGGRLEVCAPLVRSLAPCCPPARNAKQKKEKQMSGRAYNGSLLCTDDAARSSGIVRAS
jgi:hypothetical protein